MITLGELIKVPSFYRNRIKNINDVSITNIQKIKEEDYILIQSSSGKHQQIIKIHSDKLFLKAPLTVYCSCESFKFEFANALYRIGALYEEDSVTKELIQSITKRPKKKNQYLIATGCKHLIKLSQLLLKNQAKINN